MSPIEQSKRVGLKGARRSTKADDVSTAANAVSEERSESPESNASGLSGCLLCEESLQFVGLSGCLRC
jgi:hypothetical protein